MDREQELEDENDALNAEVVSLRDQADALEAVVEEWETFGDNLLYALRQLLEESEMERKDLG